MPKSLDVVKKVLTQNQAVLKKSKIKDILTPIIIATEKTSNELDLKVTECAKVAKKAKDAGQAFRAQLKKVAVPEFNEIVGVVDKSIGGLDVQVQVKAKSNGIQGLRKDLEKRVIKMKNRLKQAQIKDAFTPCLAKTEKAFSELHGKISECTRAAKTIQTAGKAFQANLKQAALPELEIFQKQLAANLLKLIKDIESAEKIKA